MPISTVDIMEACTVIANQEHLNVCIAESLKGAGMAGTGALILGVLFGPIGIAVGASLGGIGGALCAKKYTPLVQILTSMSEEDKRKFSDHMLKVIQKLDITDAVVLMSIAASPEAFGRKAIVGGLASYYGQNWQ